MENLLGGKEGEETSVLRKPCGVVSSGSDVMWIVFWMWMTFQSSPFCLSFGSDNLDFGTLSVSEDWRRGRGGDGGGSGRE